MRSTHASLRWSLAAGWLTCLALVCCASGVRGDELHLKSGVVLKGVVLPLSGLNARTTAQNNNTDVPVATLWMVDDGVRRYFIPRRIAPDVIPSDPLSKLVSFELEHRRNGNRGIPSTIGAFPQTEFDQFGRRMVTLTTPRGLEHIQQAITQIRPDALKVESTSHNWTMGLDPSVLGGERLRVMIDGAIDPHSLSDRRAVVIFFIQAQLYKQAQEELATIAADFPEQAAWAEETELQLAHLKALGALNEIRSRQQAGQHQLAYRVSQTFPAERVSADVLREAQDIVATYDRDLQRPATAGMLLDLLHAAPPQEQAQALAPLRATVLEELHPENLQRLDPFLRAEQDDTLSPEEKLALAYSGWVVGAGNAITSLDDALRLWQIRFLVLEYLRTNDNPARRQYILGELTATEGATVPRVSEMIALLPPPSLAVTPPPGVATDLDVTDEWDETQQTYSVVLPPEYSSQHRYPLLVVLHAAGSSPDQEATWWAGNTERPGPAQRYGYITIAPHYAAADQTSYTYGSEAHKAVLESLRDARKRFRIDSDRIFLAGHGMGADACFDIGMSQPGVFAGVMPITGVTDRFCMYYRANAPDLAWYVVTGERDGDQLGLSLDRNARELNHMMTRGHNVIYCEFKARGKEPYFEETPRIFDWMALHRRAPLPREWNVDILRHTDNDFYWLQLAGMPARLSSPIVWEPPKLRRIPQPMPIEGKATVANAIYLKHPAEHATVWLSPDLVTFGERLKIHHKGRQAYNDFVSPQLGDLLEDLRVRGDRERLYWAKIEL